MRNRTARVALSTFAVGAVAVACLAPTQITLHVVTDVDCAKIASNEVAIYSGDPKTSAPIAVTDLCSKRDPLNDVGTLVLVPGGDVGAAIDVTVIAGVDGLATECPRNDYTHCIRARRRLHFVPGEPLELPIELALVCQGKVCDPELTCFRGACVPIDVERANGGRCVGPECSAQGVGGPVDTLPDATVASDATVGPDGTPAQDAPTQDATGASTAFLPRDVVPRGVTVSGSEIWWTEPTADPNQTNIVHANALGPAGQSGTVLGPVDMECYGIELENTEIYCGGSRLTTSNCMAETTIATPTAVTITSCDGQVYVGVARVGTDGIVVGPNGASVASSTASANTEGGYYAEPYGDGVHVVYTGIAGALVKWDSAQPITEELVSLPKPMRGLATAKNHWLVSSADGDIYAVTKDPQGPTSTRVAKLVLSAATSGFTQIEDLAWVAATSTLFVAGVINGQAGIYKLDGLEASFP